MENSKYRDSIIDFAQEYYNKYDSTDFSHDRSHFLRVERTAKKIAKEENADIEIIEAECLLFDIARYLEDDGTITDHAQEGAKIAKEILTKINFPNEKIDSVCYSILVHRRSKGIIPNTIEAKILQDADYLDAMGAIDVIRVVASSLQSKKYGGRPIYIDKPLSNDLYDNSSAIHFLMSQIKHPKIQPENFYTKLGRELAKSRYEFMKKFVEEFLIEWNE